MPHQPLYVPLLEGKVIRLVELLPGVNDEPVSLQLLIAELDYHPEYEAVSYVWGDATKKTSASCNGRRLDITVSLDAVLKRSRYPDRPRLLWADAVCINQSHDGERSHRKPLTSFPPDIPGIDLFSENADVAFMGEVYKQARRVLVHFGDASDKDAADVSSLVREHAELVKKYRTVHDMPVLDATDTALDDPRWEALSTFHRLPWFHRKWVFQEVGLAREPICMYGREEFNYRDLMKLAIWTTRCAPQLELRQDVSFATVHTDWLDWSPNWQETSPDPSQTFLGLMNHSRWLSCSEKKDHVYALLGHSLARIQPGNELIVRPAYSKTDEEVYIGLAKWLIEDHGLRALSPIDHTEETSHMQSMPSWVPFYHDIELTACNFGVFPDFWYNASAGSGPRASPTVDGPYLRVQGLVVDIVGQSIRQTWESNDPSTLSTNTSNDIGPGNLQKELGTIIEGALSEPNGQAYDAEDRLTALSMTLCAGLSKYRCAEDDLNQHRKDFACIPRMLGLHGLLPDSSFQVDEKGEYERFLADMKMVCEGRNFIFTEKGRYGLGPMIASPGDLCCVLFGATVPFILREVPTEPHEECQYTLIGEAYVHGIMRGEAVRLIPSDNRDERLFLVR